MVCHIYQLAFCTFELELETSLFQKSTEVC